jgi:uncharacterized caspase-like protein/peptidoglycan hydrolase-like protein with peptidoglycan-binding domain
MYSHWPNAWHWLYQLDDHAIIWRVFHGDCGLMISTIARILVVLVAMSWHGAAFADKRVALVIGNSAYLQAPPLANPKNDAEAIAGALERLGFEVMKGVDLNRSEFEQQVRLYSRAIRGADVALFFYAGHGLQVNGQNYLAPVDAELFDEADLEFETLRLETILAQMEREQRTNLVFLDACRDNPLARNLARSIGTRSAGVGRGLAPIETGIGTLIAFATQPGNVALDGENSNSPFTEALVKHIETPGVDIAVLLRKVRLQVIERTNGQQVPWSNSSLTGDVVLKEKPVEPVPAKPVEPDRSAEVAYWNSIKDADSKLYFESYLKQFPNGVFASIAALKVSEIERRDAARAEASRLREQEAEQKKIEESKRAEELRLAENAKQAGEFSDLPVSKQWMAELKTVEAARAAAEEARSKAEERLAKLVAQNEARINQPKKVETAVVNSGAPEEGSPKEIPKKTPETLLQAAKDVSSQLPSGGQSGETQTEIAALPRTEGVTPPVQGQSPPDEKPSEAAVVFDAASRTKTTRGWQLFLQKYRSDKHYGPLAAEAASEVGGASGARSLSGDIEKTLEISRPVRIEVQKRLAELGYEVGGADGVFGKRTRSAISNWQKSEGMSESGFVDLAVLHKLKITWETKSDGSFVSSSMARIMNAIDLAALGEDKKVVDAITCLGSRPTIYGRFRGKTYIAIIAPWGQSFYKKLAKKCGGYLVSINSRDENRFIYNMFADDKRFFNTGSTSTGSYRTGPIIGLEQSPSGKEPGGGWKWVNGDPVKYTNWAAYQPDDWRGGQDIASFHIYKNGKVNMSNARADKWDDTTGSSSAFVMEID